MSEFVSEQLVNTLASAARSVMTKEIAKELIDVSVRHREGPDHIESLLVGPFAVIIEEASQSQLGELGLVLFALATEVIND